MAADEVTYPAPIEERVFPGTLKLSPTRVILDLAEARIEAVFTGDNGVRIAATWEGEIAATLIQQLNTANLSTKSLRRRLIERAQADGKIPAGGTVS